MSQEQSHVELLRWTLEMAAKEFGMNPRTVSARVRRSGIMPGSDKLFSTKDIHSAICGDSEAEKLRIMVASRKIAEVKAAGMQHEVEDVAEVEKSRIALVVMIRQKLLALPAKASAYIACCTDQRQIEIELEKQIDAILRDLERPAFSARVDIEPKNGSVEQSGDLVLSPA